MTNQEIEQRLNEIYNDYYKPDLDKEVQAEVLKLEKQLELAAITVNSPHLVTGRLWFIRFAARESDKQIIVKSYNCVSDWLDAWNELEYSADFKWDYDQANSEYWQMEVTIKPTSSVGMA